MEYYMKLPRNKWEFMLFMAIVSIISVNIIAPLISGFETNFSFEMWVNTLKILPFVWFAVITAVLLTYKPAGWLTNKIIKPEDSFKAHMLANTLSTVLMMSVFLTIVCTWVGSWEFSWEAFTMFFYRWPRNFAIALAVELFIAQPIARFCMHRLHISMDKNRERQPAENAASIQAQTAEKSE